MFSSTTLIANPSGLNKSYATILVALGVCAGQSWSQQPEGKIYWTRAGTARIARSSLDGSGIEILTTSPSLNLDGIAVDYIHGHIFVANFDKIERFDLDGANHVTVVTGLQGARQIALDLVADQIYWTDQLADVIRKANLDGTNVETVILLGPSVSAGIALDPVNSKLYWSDSGLGSIHRANIDGTEPELLLTGIGPNGLALDLRAGKLYWPDQIPNQPGDTIRRADLDGSNMEILVTIDELSTLETIALDLCAGKMYWTDSHNDKIQWANLDGSDVQDLIVSQDAARGIAVDLFGPMDADCNLTNVPDVCEVPPLGEGSDCNLDMVPDECQLSENDCQSNGIPDECDRDTDGDGIPDDCDSCPLDNPDDTDVDGVCDSNDICRGFDDTLDQDGDRVPDGCDPCPANNPDDTDADGVCDSADACLGFDDSIDTDGDTIPDGCDFDAPLVAGVGSRYIRIIPPVTSLFIAFQVTSPDLPCLTKYVVVDRGNGFLIDDPVFRTPDDWGTIHIGDTEVLPNTEYQVWADYGTTARPMLSNHAEAVTWVWGDVDNNGLANFADILLIVLGFQGEFFYAADLGPCVPNRVTNFADIQQGVFAFQGAPFSIMNCIDSCP